MAGQGLLAVGFDHRTSREGDPLLHTHLVIANRVQGPDGRDLYRHRLAADAIYRATYQRELVRTLGVEWTAADTHGNRELQGMPEELVRSFSKRTGQIDAELDRLVADGRERTPRLVKWTVQATRKPKQHEAPDTLYDRWRAEAAERGHDAETLVRQVTGRAQLLEPLERHGWAVLHDLAVPRRQANIDHLVIGPGGVFVIDSKQYRGRLQLDGSGGLWHGRYPLTPTLQAVSFEADQAAVVLSDPGMAVVPIVAVHGAQVPWGKVVVNGVPVVSARRLPSMLCALPAVLGPERVADLADQARVRFHPAA